MALANLSRYDLTFQLLWVKENLQESWSMVFRWMDLSDWLSYRYSMLLKSS